MTKFHINPETGNPNKCVAQPGNCKYGSDANHYDSKDEARSAYEKRMESQAAESLNRRRAEGEYIPETHDDDGVDYRLIHNFDSEYLEEYVAKIEKANRRLEKYGIKERFEYTTEVSYSKKETVGGMELTKERIKLVLSTPTISLAGNKFLAVVTQEEAGFVTKTGTDVELNGWRPESMACEHCGHKRPRSKTYLVENKDGERMQIGSTCVEAYLGVKPEGLWSIGDDPTAEIDEDRIGGGSYNSMNLARPTDHMIAYALAVSDEGKNFVSRGSAQWSDRPSTASDIETALWDRNPKQREWREEIARKADEYMGSGKAKEVLEYIRNIQGDNDYVTNLRVVAAGENMKPSNSALLISGISSWRRELDKEEKRKLEERVPRKKAAIGFAGPIKAKMKDTKARILEVQHREVADDYAGGMVIKSKIVFEDPNGHQLIWWASKQIDDVDAGDEITFTGGSIKDHKSFNGTDQTSLTRVKMTVDKKADVSAEASEDSSKTE